MAAALELQFAEGPFAFDPRIISLNPPNSVGDMSRISTFQRLSSA